MTWRETVASTRKENPALLFKKVLKKASENNPVRQLQQQDVLPDQEEKVLDLGE